MIKCLNELLKIERKNRVRQLKTKIGFRMNNLGYSDNGKNYKHINVLLNSLKKNKLKKKRNVCTLK